MVRAIRSLCQVLHLELLLYEKIAHYYDLAHANLKADIPFVRGMAQAAAGPVLELGCGSARMLLPLARAGATITGLDNSPHMLRHAEQKLALEPAAVKERATLVEADMTSFLLPGRFHLILLSYNTLMHLPPDAAQRTLRAAGTHLSDTGRLFIDLPNPLHVANTPEDQLLTLERTFTDPASGHLVLQFTSNRLDLEQQKLHVTWIYNATSPMGGPVQRLVTQVDFYYWYAHEIELMLRTSGMKLLALYGDYQRAPFSEEGERMLLLAGKAA